MQTVTWTVTGPRDAGLYQAELVIDYGACGLSFDTLALEVS